MEKKTGIIILSFGKGYHYAAQNLCFSIKNYNRNIHVTNIRSDYHSEYILPSHDFFDNIIPLDSTCIAFPALAKIKMLEKLPYENNLIIDADSLCLKDVQPLLDYLIGLDKFFVIQPMGEGNYGDDISYDLWAKHEDSYPFFGLDKENDKWHAIQSSWFFVKKGKQSKELYKQLLYYWQKGFDKNKLKNRWGKHLPDELFFSGVISKNKIDYKPEREDIMFFGNRIDTFENVNKHFFITYHGQGIGQTTTRLMYWDYYDRVLHNMYREAGMNHIYKSHYLKEAKISNSLK